MPTGIRRSCNVRAIVRSCTRRPDRTPATTGRRCTSVAAPARASAATRPTARRRGPIPTVVLLPDEASGPDDEFAWLDFAGRWGERQSGPFNGPTGPTGQGALDRPRRLAGLAAPEQRRGPDAATARPTAIVNGFCSIVENGSGALILMKTSPLTLVGRCSGSCSCWCAGSYAARCGTRCRRSR